MNVYKIGLCFVLLAFANYSSAQQLRGIVHDADQGTPLAGVSISLGQTPDINQLAITTDENGVFYTDALPPGNYLCFFTLRGYEPLLIPEVRFASGKETVLDVAMRVSSTTLPDVTIKASPVNRRSLQPLGEIPLTKAQTLRFPATFFDPARLALAYPGVANTDDQANGLTIRGNGPSSVRWRLAEIDIVNPNHTPNAGTLGDRPTTSSGGVLLFSAQLLDNSSLLTGAFPAGYGNALGGIMDMYWRKGNKTQYEFTAQAGLLGLDLAAEGPLSKKKGHSFLANYRYSTVGLLGQMGITFDGEKISFQDFSFKMDFSGKNGGNWSVFGVGGLSENIFSPPNDSADIKNYKDLFQIDFQSQTGILGVSHWAPLGKQMWWKTSVVASGQTNERLANGAGILEADETTESRIGISTTLFRRLNYQNRLQVGLNAQTMQLDGLSTRDTSTWFKGELPASLLQPWVSWNWESPTGLTAIRLGFHSAIFNIHGDFQSNDLSLEPRLLITQRLGQRHRLSLAWGVHSQLAPLWMYADRHTNTGSTMEQFPNRGLGFTRSQQVGLRHTWQYQESWVFKSELFYQLLTDVPVSADTRNAFSILNINEIQRLPALAASGLGENKGLEITAERYLSSGWFLLVNTTLFDARYQGSDATWRDSRWNLQHIANLTAGKEWQRDQWPERSRAFGVNGRITWAGSQRSAPVDVAASTAAQTTVYDLSNGYPEKQAGFVRLDLRVYWRRNIGKRRNSLLAMDFQNASIRTNTAYRYFDPYTGQVETKKQLGLIPNLSWRLEW